MQRTLVFKQIPWIGGLNTSLDKSMIPPNQLITADNVVFDTRGTRKKRDGINQNWDNVVSGTKNIVGICDFWYGATTRNQLEVSVWSDGSIYSYNSGTATKLTDIGTAWTGTITQVSFATYANRCFIAVNGSGNYVKYWDGTNSVQELPNSMLLTSISRASTGTTRTIIFNQGFPNAVGSKVVIALCPNQNYNGTFTVATVTTTSVANDTITYTATATLAETTTADTTIVAGNQAPQMSMLREHQGRLFANDKSNPDLINYCQTFDWTQWQGVGDSGGYPIGQGDGDPVGITAIFPTFKGTLFVAKKTKLYRLDGYSPDEYYINKISDGIGCVAHSAVCAIDQDDVYFVSDKGVHSLQATEVYGDFSSTYVSVDIQKTFNEGFNRSRLPYVWAAYIANINSVAFTFSSSSSNFNDALYLYNIPIKAWYEWPGLASQCITVANDPDQRRFYIGSNTNRIYKTFNGTNYDLNEAGTEVGIQFQVTTGQIYLDGDPYTMKALKRFILFYAPEGTNALTASVTVDNHALNPENSLSFSFTNSNGLLGSTFILGTTVLGYTAILGPYSISIDGVGHGCKIDITQIGINEALEIQGFAIEWEPAGTISEVFQN